MRKRVGDWSTAKCNSHAVIVIRDSTTTNGSDGHTVIARHTFDTNYYLFNITFQTIYQNYFHKNNQQIFFFTCFKMYLQTHFIKTIC